MADRTNVIGYKGWFYVAKTDGPHKFVSLLNG